MRYQLRKLFVIVPQLRELHGDFDVELSDLIEQALGRQTIGLGHQDVDADRGGIGLRDRANQARKGGPWPRPLAERRNAAIVDRDDDRRQGFDRSRRRALIRVEPDCLKAHQPRRLEPEQKQEAHQYQDARFLNRARNAAGRSRYGRRDHKSISMPS